MSGMETLQPVSNATEATSAVPTVTSQLENQAPVGFASLQAVIFAVSGFLNFLTICVFFRNRLLHTANNFLVAVLAMSDFTYITLVASTSLVSLSNEKRYSGLLCKLQGYWMQVMYSLSINLCCLISFHRFVSIVVPQQKILWSMRSVQKVVVALVVFTVGTCLPGILRSSYEFNPIVATCSLLVPEGGDAFFSMYVFLLNFTLPSSFMVMFYISIYQRVVKNRTSLVKDLIQVSPLRKKTKYLMAAVLSIYFFCWTPYYILLLCISSGDLKVPKSVIVLVWLGKLFSTVAHPVLYALCNRIFLHCMLGFLCCQGHPRERSIPAVPQPVDPVQLHQSLLSRTGNDNVSTIGSLPVLPRNKRQVASVDSSETGSTRTSENSLHPNIQNLKHRECSGERHQSTPTILRMLLRRRDLTDSTRALDRTPPESEQSSCISDQYIGEFSQSTAFTFDTTSSVISRQDSVPTVLRMPRKRRLTTDSQYVFGRTPPDSRSSSAISNYVPLNSARTSFSSLYVPSARTSMGSLYAYSYFSPQGTRPNSADTSRRHRLSRNNSARSSVRSMQSSLSSQFSSFHLPSECASPSTPNTQDTRMGATTNVEFIYIPPPDDCSPEQQQQYMLQKRSYQPPQLLEKILEHNYPSAGVSPLPGEMPENTPSSEQENGRTNRSSAYFMEEATGSSSKDQDVGRSSPRNRYSAVMFGEIEPEEACALVEEEEQEMLKNGKQGSTLWQWARRLPQLNPKVRKAVEIMLNLHRDGSNDSMKFPRSAPCSPSNPKREQIPRPRSAREESSKNRRHGEKRTLSSVEPPREQSGNRRDSFYDTMEKAVYLVLKAKRMHSRMKSSADQDDKDERSKRQIRQMPVRYVFEKPIPTYSYSQMPMMQLRVPGTVPFNVPQTIVEEDLNELPPPETPTRRRKNASTWIAPPVIDRETDDNDMRVATPGVLVEHHS